MTTLDSILSGSAGSFFGLVGVFLVFRLSGRRDRSLEAERRVAEQAATTAAAQSAAVARVVSVVAQQARDVMWAPLGRAQALVLLEACLAASQLLGAQHPAVALWLSVQHSRALTARQHYWRVIFVPGLRKRRAEAWGHELGVLAGQLGLWEQGRLDDEWFVDHT